jgi:hypothetical protein
MPLTDPPDQELLIEVWTDQDEILILVEVNV